MTPFKAAVIVAVAAVSASCCWGSPAYEGITSGELSGHCFCVVPSQRISLFDQTVCFETCDLLFPTDCLEAINLARTGRLDSRVCALKADTQLLEDNAKVRLKDLFDEESCSLKEWGNKPKTVRLQRDSRPSPGLDVHCESTKP